MQCGFSRTGAPRNEFLRCASAAAIAFAISANLLFPCRASAEVTADFQDAQATNAAPQNLKSTSKSPDDQAQPGEIVVTARKRAENIQQVPSTIRSLSGDLLEKTNVLGLSDLTRQVPGLYLISGNRQGQNQLAIRGVISLTGAQPSETATVGYYIDDTPISDSSFVPDLSVFDLQRIEVLKGPQGTLFGEGSIGGTVRLIMNKPDLSRTQVKAQLSGAIVEDGSPNTRESAAINIPLAKDVAALRLVADHSVMGGFVDDVRRGKNNANDQKITSLRAALRVQPAYNLTLDASASYQNTNSGTGAFDEPGGPDRLSFNGFFNEYLKDKVQLYTVQGRWDLGPAELVGVVSHYHRLALMDFEQRNFSHDLSPILGAPVPVTFPGMAAAMPQGSHEVDDLRTDIWAEELRLVSKGNSRFTWLVGAFHRKRDAAPHARLLIPDLAPIFYTAQLAEVTQSYTYDQWALFGEATYEVLRGLKLTAGARAFTEDFNADVLFQQAGITVASGRPAQKNKDVLFKASASYEFRPGIMIYGLFSEGQRPGGLNAQPFPAQGVPLTYGPDQAKNYEIGLKTTSLGGRLVANLSAFRIDWSQIQISVSKGGIITPLGTQRIPYIANVGSAYSEGIDFDTSLEVTNELTLGGSFTALKTKLTQVNDPTSGLAISVGSPFPSVPKFTAYAYADYMIPLRNGNDLRLRADISHVGQRDAFFRDQFNPYMTPTVFYPGAPADGSLKAYNLANFQTTYDARKWSVTAFINNAFNKHADVSLLGNYRGYIRNAPRTIGLLLRTDF